MQTGVFKSKAEKSVPKRLCKAMETKDFSKTMTEDDYKLGIELFNILLAYDNPNLKNATNIIKKAFEDLYQAHQTTAKKSNKKDKQKAESKATLVVNLVALAKFIKDSFIEINKLVDSADLESVIKNICRIATGFHQETSQNSETKAAGPLPVILAAKKLREKMFRLDFLTQMTQEDYDAGVNFFNHAVKQFSKGTPASTNIEETLATWKALWKSVKNMEASQRLMVADNSILSDVSGLLAGLVIALENNLSSRAKVSVERDFGQGVSLLIMRDLFAAFPADFRDKSVDAAINFWGPAISLQAPHPRVHPPALGYTKPLSSEKATLYQQFLKTKGHSAFVDASRGDHLVILDLDKYKTTPRDDKHKVNLFAKKFKAKYGAVSGKRAEEIILPDNTGMLVMMGLTDAEHAELWQEWFGKNPTSEVKDAGFSAASQSYLPVYPVAELEKIRVSNGELQQNAEIRSVKSSELMTEFKLGEPFCESLMIAEAAIPTIRSFEVPYSDIRYSLYDLDKLSEGQLLPWRDAFIPCKLADGRSSLAFWPKSNVKQPQPNDEVMLLGGRYESIDSKAEPKPTDILIPDPKNPRVMIGKFVPTGMASFIERRLRRDPQQGCLSMDDIIFDHPEQVTTANMSLAFKDLVGYPVFYAVAVENISKGPVSLPFLKSYYQQHNCLPDLFDHANRPIPHKSYRLKSIEFHLPDGFVMEAEDRRQIRQSAEEKTSFGCGEDYGKNGCLYELDHEEVLTKIDANPHAWRVTLEKYKVIYYGYSVTDHPPIRIDKPGFVQTCQKEGMSPEEIKSVTTIIENTTILVPKKTQELAGQNWRYESDDKQLWYFDDSEENVAAMAERLRKLEIQVLVGFSHDDVSRPIVIIDQAPTLEVQLKLKQIMSPEVYKRTTQHLAKVGFTTEVTQQVVATAGATLSQALNPGAGNANAVVEQPVQAPQERPKLVS